MGGRGSSSGKGQAHGAEQSGGKQSKKLVEITQETKKEILNRYNTFSEKQAERLSKMPKTGEKIKLEFADFVKEQTGIDITKATTKYGNNRSNFSIDFRKLTESKNENANMQALNRIKTLKSSNFDFNVMSNGAYTYLIGVENKRHKKK